MAQSFTPGSAGMQELIANFKEVYGELKDLVPSGFKMQESIPFAKGQALGKEFVEPVVLSLEGGFTYGGEAGNAFELNGYITHDIKSARVQACELVLRSAVSVRSISAAMNDKASFKRTMSMMVGNMLKSTHHRLEVALLYGRDSIGIVENVTNVVGDTSRVLIKIYDAEWASGIWVGTNLHKIDFLTPNLATLRSATNVAAFRIDSYDIENRTITIQGVSSTGAVVSDIQSSINVAKDDKIFFHGEVEAGATPTHYNFMGMKAIAEERNSLFGIANAKLPLFQGNVIDCGASAAAPDYLTFSVIERAAAAGVQKGVSDEKMTALVSVDSWSDLLEDQAAKRRYDGSEVGKLKEGARELEFYGQTGTIVVAPSTFVKNGYAFTYCEKDLTRLGNYDVTMEPPGLEAETIKLLENSNGVQMRAQSDQCLFTSRPGSLSVIRYVTNGKLTPKS